MMTTALIFGSLGWPEVLLILLAILLLFGAKRIPELMKGLGKGVKSFKQGMSEIDEQTPSEGNESKADKDKTIKE